MVERLSSSARQGGVGGDELVPGPGCGVAGRTGLLDRSHAKPQSAERPRGAAATAARAGRLMDTGAQNSGDDTKRRRAGGGPRTDPSSSLGLAFLPGETGECRPNGIPAGVPGLGPLTPAPPAGPGAPPHHDGSRALPKHSSAKQRPQTPGEARQGAGVPLRFTQDPAPQTPALCFGKEPALPSSAPVTDCAVQGPPPCWVLAADLLERPRREGGLYRDVRSLSRNGDSQSVWIPAKDVLKRRKILGLDYPLGFRVTYCACVMPPGSGYACALFHKPTPSEITTARKVREFAPRSRQNLQGDQFQGFVTFRPCCSKQSQATQHSALSTVLPLPESPKSDRRIAVGLFSA